MHNNKWSLNSWQQYDILHVPYQQQIPTTVFQQVLSQLKRLGAIVKIHEINNLLQILQSLKANNGFILHIGECVETFCQNNIMNIYHKTQQFQSIITNWNIDHKPLVTIGRIAGQYAKPRSNEYENGIVSYKGDIIHQIDDRRYNANNFLLAYQNAQYARALIKIFMPSLCISHEALFLDYESSLTRYYQRQAYNISAHFLWIGERTRHLNSAHIEYIRGIANPIGIKLSANINFEELLSILKLINPRNILGKVTLIVRMGANKIEQNLPKLLQFIQSHQLNVLWELDPMHGNTINFKKYKIRYIEDIKTEINLFSQILKHYKSYFSGIHLETTPYETYECMYTNQECFDNYHALCDPQLNNQQLNEIINHLKECLE